MSVYLDYFQWDELVAKIQEQLNKLDTLITRSEDQISKLDDVKIKLLDLLSKVDALISRSDSQLTKLDSVLSKLDSILGALGAPEPTFAVTVNASAVAANKHHLVLFNGSTYKVKVINITLNADLTGAVTGYIMNYNVHRISGYSGGTALTIVPYDPSDTLPTGITAVTAPTSVTVLHSGLLTISINPEETGGDCIAIFDVAKRGGKPIVLSSGQGITIQQYGTAGVGRLSATVIFTVA